MADARRRRLVGAVAASAVVPSGYAEPVQSRGYPVDDFEAVDLQLPADFELSPASAPGVRIAAEPKVLAAIRVAVAGGTLTIRAAGSFQTREGVRATIGFRQLRRLHAGSSANVSLSGLRGERFVASVDDSATLAMRGLQLTAIEVDLNGGGSVSAAGASGSQRLKLAGAGSYDAKGLRTDRTTVDLSGAGDVTVQARQALDVSISGAGSVRYAGDPRVTQRIDGAGSLDRI